MNSIIFIILITTTTTFPFPPSTTTLTLSTLNSSQDIPARHPCSCQLLSFSIDSNTYKITVHTDLQDGTWTAVKVRSSSECYIRELDPSRTAQMAIDLKQQGNGYEMTQSYWIDFFSSAEGRQYDCSLIEQRGQERLVYLIFSGRQEEGGDYDYVINLPKYSIGITQLMSFCLLFLLCHNIKYRRFMPIRFNFIFVLLYTIFLFATVYIDSFVQQIFDASYWIAIIFSILCVLIYSLDLTSACTNHKPIFLGISCLLTLVIALSDLFLLPDGWPVNNLIAILVAGTLIKFVVIKKLKSAVLPLLFLWLFFILRQFLVVFHIENFQQALHIKVVPLFLQLPVLFGDDETGFICSAFGTSKIITIGLVMNFCVRVDLFLSTRFYTLLSTITAFLSLSLEYLILVVADDLPVLEYTSVIIFLPVSMTLILLLSSKRGEWAELWHGSFHDIAIDRKSIKRESESILDDDQLQRNLQKLKMNPSLLTN